MRFRPSCAALVVVLCSTARAIAAVPTEPPSVCSARHVVSVTIGPTLRRIGPHRRIVGIVWHLDDRHTYVSQTGDPPEHELLPAGAIVQLCDSGADTAPYRYLIRTRDGEQRAAKRIA